MLLYRLRIGRNRQAYIGKHVIIGITFVGTDGKAAEYFQTHGRVCTIDDYQGIAIEKADGSGIYTIPPRPLKFVPARPGHYKLRATGRTVVDPDYLSNWTLNDSLPEKREDYKSRGFGPFEKRD